jgi:hypothetical protein
MGKGLSSSIFSGLANSVIKGHECVTGKTMGDWVAMLPGVFDGQWPRVG